MGNVQQEGTEPTEPPSSGSTGAPQLKRKVTQGGLRQGDRSPLEQQPGTSAQGGWAEPGEERPIRSTRHSPSSSIRSSKTVVPGGSTEQPGTSVQGGSAEPERSYSVSPIFEIDERGVPVQVTEFDLRGTKPPSRDPSVKK